EHGERSTGFPSNRRDLPSSPVPYVGPGGCRTRKLLAFPTAPGSGRSEASRCTGGIAGRTQEHGETGRQESEPFIVPGKSGNPSRGDRAEGRGGRVTGPRSGNKARTPSLSTLSTRRPRIA